MIQHFSDLKFCSALRNNLDKNGFVTLTPVQAQAIPLFSREKSGHESGQGRVSLRARQRRLSGPSRPRTLGRGDRTDKRRYNFSDLFFVGGDGRIAGIYQSREQSAGEVVEEKWILHGSSMMRRRTLSVEYDETLLSAEDPDFLLRYVPGKVINRIPIPLYYYRFHPGQASADPLQRKVASSIRERWRAARLTR